MNKSVKKAIEARDAIAAKLAAEKAGAERLTAENAAAVNAESFTDDDAAKIATKRVLIERADIVVARLEKQLADADAAIDAAVSEWAQETASEIEREGRERHAAIVKLMHVHFPDAAAADDAAQGCQIKAQLDGLAQSLQNTDWKMASRISELERVWENKRAHGTFLWLPPTT